MAADQDDSQDPKDENDPLNDLSGIPGLSHSPEQTPDNPGTIQTEGPLNFDFPTPEEPKPIDSGSGHALEGTISGVLGAAATHDDDVAAPRDDAPLPPAELNLDIAAGSAVATADLNLHPEPLLAPDLSDDTPAPGAPQAPQDPIAATRDFAHQVSPGREAVPAAFPFSLLIEGPLTVEERDKLLTVIARENMGFSEVDIEPQLESGRVLIPRISEYAGVLLVQALRGSHASLRLGPSDSIFATDDTRATLEETVPGLNEKSTSHRLISQNAQHAAESLPLVAAAQLPGQVSLEVIDTLVVSAALRSHVVEAQKSSEYHEVLDSLTRELRYRAFRKGAEAIVNFSVQLDSLGSPGRFRLTVSGTAARVTRGGLA